MAESVTPSNPLANSISLNGEEINPSVPTMPTIDTGIAPTHTTTITNQPVIDENGSNETIVTKKGRRLHQVGTILIKLKVLKVQKLFASIANQCFLTLEKELVLHIYGGARYSQEKMRQIIATAIMVHEHLFSIIEDEVWMWGFQYANSESHEISHKTARSDCLAIYEAEKKQLKALLQGWNLQKRILSFVQVPAPRRGIDVVDAIFKCLKTWGIENKVFSVSVDNASYNDSCLRALKDTISDNNSLPIGGSLFHVRFKTFIEIVENKRLKEKKLIIDCPTKWNSTYNILSVALKFKFVFPVYKEREPHYNYEPSSEDWRKVEKICKLLKNFNLTTHVISGSEYSTANLYLPEVWRVKQVIDDAIEDRDSFIREMATSMKEKFDKYWGECNMVMSLACVLDPRCKLHVIKFCFPLIYKPEHVAAENVEKVKNTLQEIYDEYAEKCHGETIISGVNTNSLVASSTWLVLKLVELMKC
nr:zinc finger BED domain-containing protein RICESLEEPER 2-like [Arachis hypogaea]